MLFFKGQKRIVHCLTLRRSILNCFTVKWITSEAEYTEKGPSSFGFLQRMVVVLLTEFFQMNSLLEAWKIIEPIFPTHLANPEPSFFSCNIILEQGFDRWNTQRSKIITDFIAAFLMHWWVIPPKNLYVHFEFTSTYFPDYSTAISVSSTRHGALKPAARGVSHSNLHLP